MHNLHNLIISTSALVCCFKEIQKGRTHVSVHADVKNGCCAFFTRQLLHASTYLHVSTYMWCVCSTASRRNQRSNLLVSWPLIGSDSQQLPTSWLNRAGLVHLGKNTALKNNANQPRPALCSSPFYTARKAFKITKVEPWGNGEHTRLQVCTAQARIISMHLFVVRIIWNYTVWVF